MFSGSRVAKIHFLDPKQIFQKFCEELLLFYKFTNSFGNYYLIIIIYNIINIIINLLC